ncbi:hypothetical protein A8F94_00645 [Bacillus sp. FJAT-27225]|uniref:DUF6376 family protein n=1 Tax=Bacillus sp. FJAT-27225 TaxID=1743144 RepID=UPI00080C2E51|nr:DUF6376 family protein [Bacillus sp. FJAT-27225]OCA90432.1 hypothetical protein A8F94_00645 [Bacillus sp. FJAT-27225]
MKKICTVIIFLMLIGSVSACASEADNAKPLNFVKEANMYAEKVKSFTETAPLLGINAVSDEQAKTDFEGQLRSMKSEIEAFNKLPAPVKFKNLHAMLLASNSEALEMINVYLDAIETDTLNSSFLETNPVLQGLTEVEQLVKDTFLC